MFVALLTGQVVTSRIVGMGLGGHKGVRSRGWTAVQYVFRGCFKSV